MSSLVYGSRMPILRLLFRTCPETSDLTCGFVLPPGAAVAEASSGITTYVRFASSIARVLSNRTLPRIDQSLAPKSSEGMARTHPASSERTCRRAQHEARCARIYSRYTFANERSAVSDNCIPHPISAQRGPD